MDFALGPEAEAFRQQLRDFLRVHHPGQPPRDLAGRRAWLRSWAGVLADEGWAGPSWPKAWGGMELSLGKQVAYHEEMTRARLPSAPASALNLVGPVLLRYGSPDQQRRYLPPMVRGEEDWCLGYSEPGAGSDLAALSTRAVVDGDHYVVNGQKVWTSESAHADAMLALVRTGTMASRQRGITMLIVDVRTPGLEIRPLRDMAGETRFSEVFFTDVRVPLQNVVGRENEGWTIARTALGIERSTNYTARDMGYRRIVDELIRLTAERGKATDPLIRQELAHLETAVRLLHLNSLRILSAVFGGDEPGPASSVSRLMHTQFEQRLHEFAVSMLGPNGMLAAGDPLAVQNGRWAWGFLRTRASTIGAGTAEVQRNTIAERILGLPAEPAVPEPVS